MKLSNLVIAVLVVGGILWLAGCGGEEPSEVKPVVAGQEDAPAATEDVTAAGGESEPAEEEGGKDGEEKAGDQASDEEPVPPDEGRIPFNRLWPNHPLARKVLPDPEAPEVYSYWKDARVGDWIRFLTHQQKVAIVTVIERDGDDIKVEFKHYELNGTIEPKEKPDIRPYNVAKDDEIMKTSALNNPFVTRSIYEDWEYFGGGKKLICEMRFVDPPTGDKNENLYNSEIRCGGFVKMRRGRVTYISLVDYGDAENPPKWDHLKASDLLSYWYKNDRFCDEPFISQVDPPEGEEPERPEDLAPVEIMQKLKKIDMLLGADLPQAIKGEKFDDAAAPLEEAKKLLSEVLAYAQDNNYNPAIFQMKKVSSGLEEIASACSKSDANSASASLGALLQQLDLLHISVNYIKEK